MLKQLAKLTVNKNADYYGEIVKKLEEAGFAIIEEYDGLIEAHYIIAKKEGDAE